MKMIIKSLKRHKEMLLKSVARIDEKIKAVKSGKYDTFLVSADSCKYMSRCEKCGRAKDGNTRKIKCSHPKVDKEFAESRTDRKCSIPKDAPKEDGIQFCKYYKKYIPEDKKQI